MNVPNTFASRFWESTKRLYDSTINYLSTLFGCKVGEEGQNDKGESKSKSVKAVELRISEKSTKESLDSVKVIKSSPGAYKSHINSKRTIGTSEKSLPKRGTGKETDSNILQSCQSIDVKSEPKPDSAEVRKIKRSHSHRSIGGYQGFFNDSRLFELASH